MMKNAAIAAFFVPYSKNEALALDRSPWTSPPSWNRRAGNQEIEDDVSEE